MAKLNKSEIAAVAAKLRREISKGIEKKKEEILKNYTPSKEYKELEDLYDKRDSIRAEIRRLEEEEEKIINSINSFCKKHFSWYFLGREPKDGVLLRLIEKEISTNFRIPDEEELKENVIIAAIDDSFSTDSFIKIELSEFFNK
jgi:hypothetical protein